MVTYSDCYADLVERGGDTALQRFDEWSNDPDLNGKGVIAFVKSMTHGYLYQVSRQDFERVAATTIHPLGDIDPKDPLHSQGIALVESLNVPWSFMQLFHRFVEEHQEIPTWQAWSGWLKGDGADYLWNPYKQMLGYDASDELRKGLIRLGVAWRLGNAYYSALRELDILIALRDVGIPVKYHLLADALFAVDMWVANRIVSVYIENEKFKAGETGGRKIRPEAILPAEAFRFGKFRIQKRRVKGVYWPVSDATIQEIRRFVTVP